MPIAEFDHVAEFPRGVDMQKREGRFAGVKGFKRQVEHDGGVFAYRIEHYGIVEFGDNFADYVDALRLKLFEVSEVVIVHSKEPR